MKKIFAAVLLSAFVAAPAIAADTASQTTASKHTGAKPTGKMPHKNTPCAAEHKNSHFHGYSMMGGNANMMMQPDTHFLAKLNLSEEQQTKVLRISDALKHSNWTTQGLFNDETVKLRDLYRADKRDPAAIGSEYKKVFDLKRRLIVTYLEAENRIEAVLTTEQRAQLKRMRKTMHTKHGKHMQHH